MEQSQRRHRLRNLVTRLSDRQYRSATIRGANDDNSQEASTDRHSDVIANSDYSGSTRIDNDTDPVEDNNNNNNSSSLWLHTVRSVSSDALPPNLYRALNADPNPMVTMEILNQKLVECHKERWQYVRGGSIVYLSDQVAKIIDSFQRLSKIMDTVSSYDPGHIAIPWAICQGLMMLAGSPAKAYAQLVEGVEYVTRLMSRYAEHENEHIHQAAQPNSDLRMSLLKLYDAMLQWLILAFKYTGSGKTLRFFRSAFPPPGKDFEQFLTNIQRAEDDVQKVMNGMTLTKVGAIARQLTRRGTNLASKDDAGTNTSTVKTSALSKEEKLQKLQPWLNATSTDDTFRKAVTICHSGTSQWILSDSSYSDWLRPSSDPVPVLPKFLWIHSPPGFGKSVLFAQILKEHNYTLKESSKHLAAFFCTSENEARRSTSAILRSWLEQLIQGDNELLKVAYEAYKKVASKPSNDQDLWNILKHITKTFPCLLCVDGLDECTKIVNPHDEFNDNRSDFLVSLVNCLQATNTRVLITSRGYEYIKTVLFEQQDKAAIHLIEKVITQADTAQDILEYTKSIMRSTLPHADDSTCEDLAAGSAERSEGMFLYVNLLKRGWRKGDTVGSVRKAITRMPAGLNTVYEEELRRILQDSSRSQAVAVFRWLLFTTRPLTLRELAEALILTNDTDFTRYPEDDLPPGFMDGQLSPEWVDATIIRHCGAFVELRKTNESDSVAEQTAHFPHASIREFLLVSLKQVETSDDGLQDPEVETDRLGLWCLRYLCYDVFNNKNMARLRANQFAKRYPFIFYATNSWYEHIQNRGSVPEALHTGLESLLNPRTKNWVLWSEIFEGHISQPGQGDTDSEADSDEEESDASSSVASSTSEHLEETSDSESNEDETASKPDSKEHTPGTSASERGLGDLVGPLYYAALLGMIELVKKLIAQGASQHHQQTGKYGYPLQAAVIGGHTDVVEYLLESSVDVNVVGGVHGTALVAAASVGNVSFVEKLLRSNADATLTNADGGNALHVACQQGNYQVAELLIKYDTKLVHSKTARGNTPLGAAVTSGNMRLVEALKDAHVDLNTTVHFWSWSGSALCTSMIHDHLDIAKYLIKRKVDIESRDSDGQTALCIAALRGNEKMFNYLLKKGANLKVQDNEGRTILHHAVHGGSMSILKTVIEADIDINGADKSGYRPIHYVGFTSHTEVAQFLLDNGAEDCVTGDLGTAVTSAIKHRQIEVAKILVKNGMSIFTPQMWGYTALDLAIDGANEELIRFMIRETSLNDLEVRDNDASQEPKHSCPDFLTAVKIYEAIINQDELILLERCDEALLSQIVTKDHLSSALLTAVTFSSTILTKGLLDRGADTSCRTHSGRLPILIAAGRLSLGIFRLLLDYGASVHESTAGGLTAAHMALSHGLKGEHMLQVILEAGGLFQKVPAEQYLQPNAEVLQKFTGSWLGEYKYLHWNTNDSGDLDIEIDFIEDTERYPHKLPWFRHEGYDQFGQVVDIGFVYGSGKCRVIRLYQEHGWLYEGQLEPGVQMPEELAFRGHWGECVDNWHGTFEFRKEMFEATTASVSEESVKS